MASEEASAHLLGRLDTGLDTGEFVEVFSSVVIAAAPWVRVQYTF